MYNIYNHGCNIRNTRTGGGVSLFISQTLIYRRRPDITLSTKFNYVAIEIQNENINVDCNVVISIYRPPNTSIKDFNEELKIILELIDREKKVA